MEGISSKAAGRMDNHKKFVGQEFDVDLGVNLYEFKWRHHDPQIGRFIEIDPLADKYVSNSTYAYAENRPINSIDLEGLESVRRIDGNCIFISVSTQSVNNTTRATNDYIKAVNKSINQQINALFSKTDPVTGISYSANYTSKIVEKGTENNKNDLVVRFVDIEPGRNGHSGAANSQNGELTVGVLEIITDRDKFGNETTRAVLRPESEVATTVIHEYLHGEKIPHPWEPGSPSDIAQYNADGTRSDISDDTIIYNVMNSGGNDIKVFRNTYNRNNLTLGQVKATDNGVKKDLQSKDAVSQK